MKITAVLSCVAEVMFIHLIGTIIKERYCILEKIGSGGNGKVYLAVDMELGSKWAVKVIEIGQRKEALLLKEFQHPYLPKMIDYEENETNGFLVMEYIEGENLEQYLKRKKSITDSEVLEMSLRIAEIMVYFHKQNPPFIYGDMKPANLIRTEDGDIYLVDFGSVVRGLREIGMICHGTKGYAAPEQYQGKMSTASDVYAFGKTIGQILKSSKELQWSAAWKWLIFRCCHKKEKYRYQNMKIVLGHLKKIKTKEKLQNRILKSVILGVGIWFGMMAGVMEMTRLNEMDEETFEERLEEVTDIYWEDIRYTSGNQYQAESMFSEECCSKVEEELKEMYQEFTGKEEQRRILGLLAINAEYMEAYRNAAFYYEQIIFYDETYEEGYGMYGLFLERMEMKEESLKLYEDFQDRLEEEYLKSEREDSCNYYVEKWIERLKEHEK